MLFVVASILISAKFSGTFKKSKIQRISLSLLADDLTLSQNLLRRCIITFVFMCRGEHRERNL